MLSKLTDAFGSLYGWIVATTTIVVDSFCGHGVAIYLAIFMCLVDMLLGIRVAHSRKVFTLSELMRDTVGKAEVYGLAILIFLSIDALMPAAISVTTEIICSLIVVIEGWSSAAMLLILHPDTPLLRLLQKKLTGEIANKLDVEPSEVEEILNQTRLINKKRNGRSETAR